MKILLDTHILLWLLYTLKVMPDQIGGSWGLTPLYNYGRMRA